MVGDIRHRGPDGTGMHVRGPVALGHSRLATIDLACGGQPMSNEDGSVWIVYNGETYNFAEIRRSLESQTDIRKILDRYRKFIEQHRLAAVLVFVITYWVSEAIPIPVSALLGLALVVIVNAAPAPEEGDTTADVVFGAFASSQISLRVTDLAEIGRLLELNKKANVASS